MKEIAILNIFIIFVVMDFQFWVYIIIGIIYFLSRVLKKTEQPADLPQKRADRQPEYPTSAEKPKQLTFEELLKEITEAKQPEKPVYQPQQRYQPEPKQDFVDYDDDIKEEEQDPEDVNYDYRKKDKQYYDTYEEAKRQAFVRPSLEETMNISDTVMKFGKFKAFEQDQQRNLLEEYTKDFRDPDGLKKAVVMSEILNRKF